MVEKKKILRFHISVICKVVSLLTVFICDLFSEAIPISYVVPVSSIPIPNSGVLSHGANSPRAADGRSVTSEDTRSDSGKSEEDGELYDATSPVLPENTGPVGHQIIRVRVEEIRIVIVSFISNIT